MQGPHSTVPDDAIALVGLFLTHPGDELARVLIDEDGLTAQCVQCGAACEWTPEDGKFVVLNHEDGCRIVGRVRELRDAGRMQTDAADAADCRVFLRTHGGR